MLRYRPRYRLVTASLPPRYRPRYRARYRLVTASLPLRYRPRYRARYRAGKKIPTKTFTAN